MKPLYATPEEAYSAYREAPAAFFERYLRPGGFAIIGGDFGPETQELGVMRRTRSLELWEQTLDGLGLEVCDIKRFDWANGGINEGLKNNLLAFRAKG